MSAAAASRDITLFHAYELLHQHNYDVAEAIKVSKKIIILKISHHVSDKDRSYCPFDFHRHWFQHQALYCVVMRWKIGQHQKQTCLKRR